MNRFRKLTIVIILLELFVLIAGNVICMGVADTRDRIYRVEAKRVAEEVAREDSLQIDLSKYTSIKNVAQFNPDAVYNYDYVVERANEKLIAVEYTPVDNNKPIMVMNIIVISMILLSIIMLIYIQQRIIRPFSSMEHLTVELSKGNLATPVKAERSKYFGKFLWGMDMLRETLEDKKEKELEYQKEKKMLILSLSHDIKTPLSAIELYTKALKSGLYDSQEKIDEALIGILNNTETIKKYVNEITTASKEDFLNLQVRDEECYLSEIVRQIEIFYKEKLQALHTEFVVEDIPNCLIKGDKDRLIEVFQNIIENAIKYGDGKSIEISGYDEEDYRLISVKNTGCTLDSDEITHLFDSFYRGSNSEGEKGSGLGLYICKHLMKKMDGDIFARVTEGNFEATVVIKRI